MNAWIFVWSCVFVVVIVIFSVLTIAVAIGGFYDVKAMFSSIDRRHEQDEDPEDAPVQRTNQ